MSKRKLVNITLEEAEKVLELGEGHQEDIKYLIRKEKNVQKLHFAQLYYVYNKEEHISVNFSDSKNAVMLCEGNTYYRTMYKIIKYLERRGFDLKSADKK